MENIEKTIKIISDFPNYEFRTTVVEKFHNKNNIKEMMEWVNSTVNRIQLTEPKNIYEIGCGSGLLLYRLAPDCITYCGTDYSEEIISKVEKVVNSNEDIKNKTKVMMLILLYYICGCRHRIFTSCVQ